MSLKRNIVANVLGRSYGMVSVYLFVPFYVATLGVERYGVIAFYAILLSIAGLVDIGLSATLSREAAREVDRTRVRNLLATIERVLLASALIFALVVVAAAETIAHHWLNTEGGAQTTEVTTSLRMMALMIPLQLGISLYTSGLLGLERQATANVLQAAFVTVRGGFVIPLMYLQPSLTLFFGWQLAATLVFFIAARLMFMRAVGAAPWSLGHATFNAIRPILGFAGGMFAITLLAVFNTQMDKIVVSKLFTIEQFGSYSLASTLAQLPSTVIAPLLTAMLPRLTRLISEGDETTASLLFSRFCRLVSAISGTGAMGLIFFAPEVLSLWLGRANIDATTVMIVRILAVGGLFQAIQAGPFTFGVAHGHTRTTVIVGFGILVAALPLLLWGSHRFGLAGAALPWVLIHATHIAAMFCLVLPRYYRGSLPSLLGRDLCAPVVVCAVAMGGAKIAAMLLGSGPLASCAIAAVAGGGAVLAIARKELLAFLPSRRPTMA